MTQTPPNPGPDNPLEQLRERRPDLAEAMATVLDRADPAAGTVVEDIRRGDALSAPLARQIAAGYESLLRAEMPRAGLLDYSRTLRRLFPVSVPLADIVARNLPPVLITRQPRLLENFTAVLELMRQKWLYALTAEPLDMVGKLLADNSPEAALAWLAFLRELFRHDLTYNQYRRFTSRFPQAVLSFPVPRRTWRLEQMRRVVAHDFELAVVFTEALTKELSFLNEAGLRRFVDEGLRRYAADAQRGFGFLGTNAKEGQEAARRLQSAARLVQVQSSLQRYLRARCGGGALSVKSLSACPDTGLKTTAGGELVAFDGATIYLVDQIDRWAEQQENVALYKALGWVESGLFECGTFSFDLERACPEAAGRPRRSLGHRLKTDLEAYWDLFGRPDCASVLFSILEYGRARTLLTAAYPGGAKRSYQLLRRAYDAGYGTAGAAPDDFWAGLFLILALGGKVDRCLPSGNKRDLAGMIQDVFLAHTAGRNRPEATATGLDHILAEAPLARPLFAQDPGPDYVLPMGFGLRPHLYAQRFADYEQRAQTLKARLAQKGIRVYKSDVVQQLRRHHGQITTADMQEISAVIAPNRHHSEDEKQQYFFDAGQLDQVLPPADGPAADSADGLANVYRYQEWDHHLGDYRPGHVQVRSRPNEAGAADFYDNALARHAGLVKKIRYAFELLKPVGISRLRRWPEGDEFDYGHLLEFLIDKKTGHMPSDRIYLKRLKDQREVAVMLLVDISRSTSRSAPADAAGRAPETVMDLQKEALVLFCEALTVVGDAFAIAGFSGTGRLGVDYFMVKAFEDPLSGTVRRKIAGLRPQRNTRMGAAVRHATASFATVPARSPLLILISDGFPNDVDYKQDYALADTRRALLEARARGISVHAITVNFAGDARLDELYGKISHSVISDVRQLPDKLLRLYGRLTG